MRDLLLGMRAALDEQLRPHGVTGAQVKVLWHIETTGPMTGAQAARLCHVTPQTVQALMVRSEQNGLVVRSAHPDNERLVLWSLTPRGKRLMRRARGMFEAMEARVWSGMGLVQMEAVSEALAAGLRNLRGDGVA